LFTYFKNDASYAKIIISALRNWLVTRERPVIIWAICGRPQLIEFHWF